MILSVSRRTDIPCYYSEWFFNRIKEGFVYVRNPMNEHQVSKIDITPEVVDCIVFWSKKEKMLPIFQELSRKIGSKKVIWRYDPIIFTKKYTPEYHLNAFEQIATALNGYTQKCVISFVDTYAKTKKNMQLLGAYDLSKSELMAFAKRLSEIAGQNQMTVGSCAENIDLVACDIVHNSCIDKALIEDVIGCRLKVQKDKNQRSECGCVESVEIGTYNTCKNGCKYCYANYSEESVRKNCSKYDAKAPILCSVIDEKDKITVRRVTSLKERQLQLDI